VEEQNKGLSLKLSKRSEGGGDLLSSLLVFCANTQRELPFTVTLNSTALLVRSTSKQHGQETRRYELGRRSFEGGGAGGSTRAGESL
jgi:hypothetical protein